MKEMLKAKRAFSPVIAALILMLLAVATGVVVYAYVMGWIGGATRSEGGQSVLSLDASNANATTNMITAYVRNIGGKSVTPSKAYVDNYEAISISPTTVIAEGAVATLTINATSPGLATDITYEVKIVCTDGTSLTFNVKAA